MKPVIGSRVVYKLTSYDAANINRRRADFAAFNLANRDAAPEPGAFPGRSGHVGHFGNPATEGDVYPADVVRIFTPGSTTVNLQVHLDGNDHHWATSAPEGDGPGQWMWPDAPERELGTVFVHVRPNVDGFAEELQREIDRATSELHVMPRCTV